MNPDLISTLSSDRTTELPISGLNLSAAPRLERDSVHIWIIPIEGPGGRESEMRSCLADDERYRLDRYYHAADRNRFLISHWALRTILGKTLGMAPDQVQYTAGRNGKPALSPGSSVHFNLAHSGGLALVAVSRIGAIGVDIEQVRQVSDLKHLARTCFSPGEQQKFFRLSEPEHQNLFFTTWARKEAFIKAVGDGLSYPLDQFEVSLLPGEPARIVSISGSGAAADRWILRDIPVAEGYAAAFAIQASSVSVSQIRLTEGWKSHE